LPVKQLFEDLRNAVVIGDVRRARKIAEQVVNRGLNADAAMEKLMEAMEIVDKRYERKDYFTTDVAAAASAMREAFRVLEPYLQVKPKWIKAKVVIGALGETQGIGKDVVTSMLRAAGFTVIDLKANVEPKTFVESALQEKAQIIAISVFKEEYLPYLRNLIDMLEENKLREKIKVVVGGSAVSEQACKEYGVDAYAKNAWDCVKKVRQLIVSFTPND